MNPVTVISGSSPLVLAQPHSGTLVPDDIRAMLTERGAMLADTDWHIPQLYEGLAPDATIVRAEFNRYVIDANRPPDGASLYPGQNTTGLVPMVDFEDRPLWREEPDEDEIAQRLETFHAPYHAALRTELDRVRAQHGFAVLYDCHSIRSRLPFLFEGRLPDLNIGTNGGETCAP
ncbi:MAG: N-formylglutamate amidohydrolase, partial [Erythrobacter sp.]